MRDKRADRPCSVLMSDVLGSDELRAESSRRGYSAMPDSRGLSSGKL